MGEMYEFQIAGRLSPELLSSFAPYDSATGDHFTVFTRVIGDEGEFFGIIVRFQTLGLKLVSLRRVPVEQPKAG